MAATGTGLILLIAFGLCATGAVAQAQAVPPGLDRPADWTLDTGKPKPARRKAAQPVASDEATQKAARLAERRKKFFESKPDDRTPDKIPEFGGYDASKMGTETVHPGATFKF